MMSAPRDVGKRSTDERGLSLVELIVAIAITGIIATAITNSLLVGLKTTEQTSDRLADSHELQMITTYFPNDVANTRSVDISTAAGMAPESCTGLQPDGSNVVSLPSAESSAGPDRPAVTYRLEGKALVRYVCGAPGTVRLALATTVERVEVVSTPEPATEQGVTTMTVELSSGRKVVVTGHPRSGKTPPDLTSPTATSALPLPCGLVSVSPVSPSIALSSTDSAQKELSSDLVVSVVTEGACVPPLFVAVTPSTPGPERSAEMVLSGDGYIATLPAAGPWTAGAQTLTISDADSTQIVERNFSIVPAPCELLSDLALAPRSVARSQSTSPSQLASSVVISISTSVTCTGLEAQFRTGNGSSELRKVALTQGARGTWSRTIGATDYATWTNGNKDVYVYRSGSTTPLDSDQLNVRSAPLNCAAAPAFTFVGGSSRTLTGSSLSSPIVMRITATGTCTGLSVVYTKNLDGGRETSQLGSRSGTTYTFTLPAAAIWSVGSRDVTLAGALTAPKAPVEVSLP